MERETMSTAQVIGKNDEVLLPGFRFHPTDEELVGFYLQNKVEKKLIINLDHLIKQINIYNHDPWDLPKVGRVGEKEGYFFCRRGRKYKNSIRPNRVTGSGFWKATGIDKPIYSVDQEPRDHECIGLKKSLVYYRGSAGKGTKTDWMMHEFRLPDSKSTNPNKNTSTQEAEVWTLCRIFKRDVSNKKYGSEWRKNEISKRSTPTHDSSSITCSSESNSGHKYLSFGAPFATMGNDGKPFSDSIEEKNMQFLARQHSLSSTGQVPYLSSCSSFSNPKEEEIFKEGNWDELMPMVEFAVNPSLLYSFR
ncbi:hypothetical protein I3760_09G148200 [Carya illinoinensis]|nr:hypothetical protein I3760_09G148200 [Carya illinoinensis]